METINLYFQTSRIFGTAPRAQKHSQKSLSGLGITTNGPNVKMDENSNKKQGVQLDYCCGLVEFYARCWISMAKIRAYYAEFTRLY